jgi:predicted ATPase
MLRLAEVSTRGYRSLRAIDYPVGAIEVFVGANGVGKTNLYRGLELLQAAAANTLGAAIAQEGLASALWAGPRRGGGQPRIALSARLAGEARGAPTLEYAVEIGFPGRPAGAFEREPEIKAESVSLVTAHRTVRLVDRKGPMVMARDDNGAPADVAIDLLGSETVLARLQDPGRYPELDRIRRPLLEWRFYHQFRTDGASPLRRPAVAVASPTLASDGANLAAVFATLAEIRQDTAELDERIAAAFPGGRLIVEPVEDHAAFGMVFPEFPRRTFSAAELSDGTLQFLALAGALLAYRLPPLVALNEPEGSLHPDLMPALADMIVSAGRRTQVWLVTHSRTLADLVGRAPEAAVRTVVKRDGATWIEGLKLFGSYDEDDDA